MDNSTIVVRGAREHNLRNVSLDLPRNKLIVFTGVSGSGKSSLAFDTLYAEGQRRYVESLSSYARQFLGQLPKPDVDYLGGLSPAISIQQKTASRNPRSTVGTVTEVYHDRRMKHHIAIVIDRLVNEPKVRPRLAEAVEQALGLANGSIIIAVEGPASRERERPEDVKKAPVAHAPGSPGHEDLLLSAHYA